MSKAQQPAPSHLAPPRPPPGTQALALPPAPQAPSSPYRLLTGGRSFSFPRQPRSLHFVTGSPQFSAAMKPLQAIDRILLIVEFKTKRKTFYKKVMAGDATLDKCKSIAFSGKKGNQIRLGVTKNEVSILARAFCPISSLYIKIFITVPKRQWVSRGT